jgi:hypothetical protein
LRQCQRIAQDFVFQGLLTEQTLQFAHLVLQCRYSEAGTTSSPAPTADSAPSAYSRRQVNTWSGAIPCCRATSDTDIPGTKFSWTIRAFSSADQRRRR